MGYKSYLIIGKRCNEWVRMLRHHCILNDIYLRNLIETIKTLKINVTYKIGCYRKY